MNATRKPRQSRTAGNRKSRRTRGTRRSHSTRRRNGGTPPRQHLPKTAHVSASTQHEHQKHSRATSGMSLTELQFMAKGRGIPFGGLNKTRLIHKINKY